MIEMIAIRPVRTKKKKKFFRSPLEKISIYYIDLQITDKRRKKRTIEEKDFPVKEYDKVVY